MDNKLKDDIFYFCTLIEYISRKTKNHRGDVYKRQYQMLIVSVSSNVEIEKNIKEVFSFFISDEISNFNSNVYYSNPDYLRCSYLDGRMLA